MLVMPNLGARDEMEGFHDSAIGSIVFGFAISFW
jgi:hypothetical protein